ncbi:hypothetical protein PhaeoP75_01743 [Phaeobacter gallaeciensis]|uniref:Uncharacterized protein n=1 Tax=Phaeobacter gallaeciensis TaxID=60890 RepID=A0AAC9Z8N0_9RHOB|nr:hypothetical protein Gal_01702 [Phaeobacter gallaeciensis DSM 26640]ATE92722.1 hypothetical protein PhaeoP11_01693 [Phaeobacter gallaeciensis]ATE97456.1 hypothetical protein PhaeoP73_02153 [Phaeobacter gallaeciensis]ATF01387.1 hypothetical protein PhaeoP75_01743 [Phaeobacter gallaeciensis]ATF05767.1 hypothetical protein PhaeoP63_01691 [Phaeobacter gallaeciensis]
MRPDRYSQTNQRAHSLAAADHKLTMGNRCMAIPIICGNLLLMVLHVLQRLNRPVCLRFDIRAGNPPLL